jgi:iron complex outermembrane receptor protein
MNMAYEAKPPAAATTGEALDAPRRLRSLLLAASACLAGLTAAGEAHAQNAQLQEVVVTARKRQESVVNVPVIESVVSGSTLDRLQTNNLHDITKLVPGVQLGETVLSTGTQVSLRGVGTSALAAGVEQSVSLVVDGLQLTQGLSYSSAMFDVGQVEVLKGPQSLFYGKSSPAGVISVRTADPTNKQEIILRGGYEFEAREKEQEFILSGPITDTLKARLAGMYSQSDGFFKNPAQAEPGAGGQNPIKNRWPYDKEWVLRGTVLWAPSSKFDARLKMNAAYSSQLYAGTGQLTSCPDGIIGPFGTQFLSPQETCRNDRTGMVVNYDPAVYPGVENGGTPYLDSYQAYGTLEMNYHPRTDLTVTSSTGWYNMKSSSLLNTSETSYAGPIITFSNVFKRHDFTEEVRINSDFSTPLNFSAGGFYQNATMSNLIREGGNTLIGFPPIAAVGSHNIDIKSYSLFGQLRWKIIPTFEIAAGARWTDEKRADNPIDLLVTPTPIALAVPKIASDNISPELTLTYRPKDTITVFASLKEGYKSGSFGMSVPATPGQDVSFGDEKVQGGEFGVKTRLFDRRLSLDISAYDYRYTGLQVGATEPPKPGELSIERIVNAGSALVQGIEAQAVYLVPQVDGLTVNAAANWNHARFQTLNNVPCYGGQEIREGCNQDLDPNTGLYLAQGLSGTPLVRAPDWQVNFGFTYDRPIANGMSIVITNANQFVSKYPANLGPRADTYQQAYFKSDLSLQLNGPDDRWELALIGKNLGNQLTAGNCTTSNFQNGLLGGFVTGGTVRGPAGVDEVLCFTDRGRELWIRATWKPLN